MELSCEKYKEKVDPEHPLCRHPDDYCQFRSACIIEFIEKENRREQKRSLAGFATAEKKTG